jgi:hypothetical protein
VTCVILSGCGGGGNSVFPNIFWRATWGQTNGKIAFAWLGGTGVNYYLSTIPQGGGSETLLTPSTNANSGLEGGYDPSFNAAGDKLAFASRRDAQGSDGIYVMNATPNNPNATRLTADTAVGFDFQPFWVTATAGSYAGLVVYSSSRPGGTYGQILAVNPTLSSSQTPTPVMSDSGHNLTWPTVSPDGALLAYGETTAGGQTLDQYNSDAGNAFQMVIHVRRLADGADFVVVDSTNQTAWAAAHSDAPAFSPDSHTLAFHTNVSGGFEIWVADISQIESGATAPGSFSPVELTFTANSHWANGYPVYSPNVLGTNGSPLLLYLSNRELWTIDSNPHSTSPNPVRLTQSP